MNDADVEFEALMNQADVAFASGDVGFKVNTAAQLQGWGQAHAADLAQWQEDQIDAGWTRLTGNGPGTWKQKNAYTTSAAAMKDDSIIAQVKSPKFAADLKEGLAAALKNLGEGALKGSGSTLIKVGAIGAVLYFIYRYAAKKGVL